MKFSIYLNRRVFVMVRFMLVTGEQVSSTLDFYRATEQRSHVSVGSPDKSAARTESSIYADDASRYSPDSSGLTTPRSKKLSMVGRQSTAIQRAKMDQINKEIRAKQVAGEREKERQRQRETETERDR